MDARRATVGWRRLRRKRYRVSRWPEQVVGDNFPVFPAGPHPPLGRVTDR